MKSSPLQRRLLAGLAALMVAAMPTVAAAHRGDGYVYRDDGRPYAGEGYGRPAYRERWANGRNRRCHGGSGGAILGAIAGGLLGGSVAGYHDRTAGTLVGGGLGAFAGNAIARNC